MTSEIISKTVQDHSFSSLSVQYPDASDDQSLISVIVRTKDRLSLFEEALSSIAEQTWPYIEVVVCNDGLNNVDGVIEKFNKAFYKIICVKTEKKNGRVAAANKGIETATGDWIMFLDDDDLLEPDACWNLMNKAVETNALVVYGKVLRRHYLDNGHVDMNRPEYVYGRPFNKDLIVMENYIPFNALMIRRCLAHEVYPLREELKIFEDWDFLIALSRKADFVYLPIQVAIYRCWESSTATGSRFSHDEIMEAEQLISQKWHRNITFRNILAFREYIVEQTREAICHKSNIMQNNSITEPYQQSFVEKILMSVKMLKKAMVKKLKFHQN